MPLTRDSANLETNISLSNGGTTTPLRILVEEDRVTTSILPLDILSPDTLYTLSLSTGLETLYGNTLSAPQSFTFRTKAVAQAGELDLTRFYLEWDGGDLYVKAPAQAYPDRTYLEITNEEGGDTWSGTLLTSSDFSQIIGGEPGQSVELSAVTPNGARLEHRLETVVLAGDKILLGSTAFAHALSEELAFRGDDPGEGFGRELELRTVDGTVIDGDIAAVATLGNTTTFQALYGMELSVADGTGLPGMNGRIEFDFDVVNAPDSLVHLIALIPGIMAPDDPEDPATLTSHTIAQHLDSLRVESNQLVGKYQSRGKRNLSGKQSLSYNLNDVAHLDVTKVRLAVVQQPFSAAKRGALGPGLGWLNKATLYAVRKLPTGELAPALKPIFETPYQPSQWQIPWLAQHRPAPLSFFYKITAGPTPIPTFLGVADATGKASLFTDADLLDVRAVDPITSEYIGIGYASENGENAITEGIAVGRGFAIFDPESNLISKGEALPPRWGFSLQ